MYYNENEDMRRIVFRIRFDAILTLINPGLFLESPEFNTLVDKRQAASMRRYQSEIGVTYYNIDVSDTKKVMNFLLNSLYLNPRSDTDNDWATIFYKEKDFKEGIESALTLVREDQSLYRSVVDKVMRKERLENDEMRHLDDLFANDVFRTHVTQSYGKLRLVNTPRNDVLANIPRLASQVVVRAGYLWVIRVSNEKSELKRCDQCTNIFVPHAGGHLQRHCSEACKAKSYRQRRKLDVPSR